MRKIVFATLLSAFASTQVHARTVTSIISLKAERCESQKVGYQIHTCSMIMNMIYDDGMNSFAFVPLKDSADKGSISFLGDGKRQIKHGANVAEQPIVAITLTVVQADGKAESVMFNAIGSCKFGNPTTGVSEVSCTADAEQGKGTFTGNFRSDGSQPKVLDANTH